MIRIAARSTRLDIFRELNVHDDGQIESSTILWRFLLQVAQFFMHERVQRPCHVHWTVAVSIKLNLSLRTLFRLNFKTTFCSLNRRWIYECLSGSRKKNQIYRCLCLFLLYRANAAGRQAETGFWKSILKLDILLPVNVFAICINFPVENIFDAAHRFEPRHHMRRALSTSYRSGVGFIISTGIFNWFMLECRGRNVHAHAPSSYWIISFQPFKHAKLKSRSKVA